MVKNEGVVRIEPGLIIQQSVDLTPLAQYIQIIMYVV